MRGAYVCLLLASFSQAVNVYLSPSPQIPFTLSPSQASFVLSRHLGLDYFESPGDAIHEDLLNEHSFVGQGAKNGLLLTVSEEDVRDVLPLSMKLSFSLSDSPSVSSLSSLTSTYLHRASHTYTTIYSVHSESAGGVPSFLDVFSASSSEAETFVSEMYSLSMFLDSDEQTNNQFAAFELQGLTKIANVYSRSSEQYQTAARTVRAMLESAKSKTNLNLALLTYSAAAQPLTRRQQHKARPPQSHFPAPSPIPQQPISGISTCFTSADVCANSTNSCSGRGECMQASKAGKTCFVCACNQTSSQKGKTQNWVGGACERKDISGPFVLLAGSSIALILIIVASVSLLAGVGGEKLPSTLTGSAVNVKRE